MNEHGLNERQLRFANLYLESLNATESYIKAGYAARGNAAEVTASQLLRNPKVEKYIEERLKPTRDRYIASADDVLEFLSSVMSGKATGKTLRGVGGGDQVISDIEPSIAEKTKAAELLGKRHRLFTEQVDLNANVGVTIVDDVEDDE